MKALYVPKGRTLRYETLSCHDIVNDGVLEVEGALQARNITGKGILKAGTVSASFVSAMSVDASGIVAERLAAERVCAVSVRASSSILTSCCLEAEYVETSKLIAAQSEIGQLRAKEVVSLPDRRRSILAALTAGFFRRLWLDVLHRLPRDAKLVLLLDGDFDAYYSIPGALFGILDHCRDAIPELEHELEEASGKRAHFPSGLGGHWKEAA